MLGAVSLGYFASAEATKDFAQWTLLCESINGTEQ